MRGLLDAALSNPWRTMDTFLDGPLHPGGSEATARLLDRAGVDATTRVLDVGCGAGDALSAARARGADAVGLDTDPATDRAVRGAATHLPVRDDCFDVVLAECVLCLTDLDAALAECRRALDDGGRLAVSDVVVAGEDPVAVPDALAETLCLDGARRRDVLTAALADAGFDAGPIVDHHDDLLAMRDRVRDRVDYDSLLGAMGERGRRLRDAIRTVEAAVEDGRVSYVSVVARAD
jgi:arsenite methyltransferase